MANRQHVVIIGAGVAGLATAIRLAIQGYTVTAFDKNNFAGGKVGSLQLGNYYFDTGPSLFVEPENLEELFELANEPVSSSFTYTSLPIVCKYFFAGGEVVSAYADAAAFDKELSAKLHEKPGLVQDYLKEAAIAYQAIGQLFLNNSLHTSGTFFSKAALGVLKKLRPGYLFRTLNGYNQQRFLRPETIQLFNRFATYNGSDPYQAPGMLSMIPHLEHNAGVYFPAGGMKSITEALYKLALKQGVKFHLNTAVQKIAIANRKVQGVFVNDEMVKADIVVSNADVYYTYKNLLDNTIAAKKLKKQERSTSAIVFYWGVRKSFPSLELHNIFFSKDYRAEFATLSQQKSISNDPTIYVNITAKMEAGHAPPGCENWFVMVNVPADNGQNWSALKQQCRTLVLQKLSNILQVDLESLIEVEADMDPVAIEEQTAAFAGALYGSSSNSSWAAFLRHANFSKKIAGLYFAGGTVHPGGGIPLCLKSAKLVSNLVAANKNKKHA